jgi:hypothetical protein
MRRWSSGSVLASGPKVRGFKPGRGRWIFKGDKKSVARLPSEGKLSRRSHIVDLWHVKEPYEHEKMLCRQNSAAMFLTHVFPASLLDGSSRRVRIE